MVATTTTTTIEAKGANSVPIASIAVITITKWSFYGHGTAVRFTKCSFTNEPDSCTDEAV